MAQHITTFPTGLVTGYRIQAKEAIAEGGGDTLPPGWTVHKEKGKYIIYHNLGLTNLSDLVGTFSVYNPPEDLAAVVPYGVTANSVLIKARGPSGGINTDFSFIAFHY